jgi:hypothetical protein
MKLQVLAVVACNLFLLGCATQPPGYSASPGITPIKNQVWFTGASNIRHFTCYATRVSVRTEPAAEEIERTRPDGLPAVKRATLEIPVRSLDCGIGLQNSHLFETLGAASNPAISFVLGDFAVNDSAAKRYVSMNGALKIAGVERWIVLRGQVVRDGDGKQVLAGERRIDMREFGVQAPRRFFGLLRVSNQVTVHFLIAVPSAIDHPGILTGNSSAR